MIHTTAARRLTVLAVPATTSVPQAPAPTAPSVTSLVGTSLHVRSDGTTAVELECEGDSCRGKITLRVRQIVKKKARRRIFRLTVIGSATFSALVGKRSAVDIHLNATGWRLLSAGQGHLGASLQIEQEASSVGQATEVHLFGGKPPPGQGKALGAPKSLVVKEGVEVVRAALAVLV